MIKDHEQKHRLYDKLVVQAGPWAQRPPNLADGLLYKDTDRGGLEFSYNAAAAQWLSTGLYSWSGAAITGISATTLNSNITDFNEDVYSIYITKFVFVSIMVGGTYNSTNTWTVQLKRQDDTAVISNIGSAVDIWQTGRVIGRRYHNVLAINTVYAPATTKLFLMDLTKVGAAGTFVTESPTLWYRLVG